MAGEGEEDFMEHCRGVSLRLSPLPVLLLLPLPLRLSTACASEPPRQSFISVRMMIALPSSSYRHMGRPFERQGGDLW